MVGVGTGKVAIAVPRYVYISKLIDRYAVGTIVGRSAELAKPLLLTAGIKLHEKSVIRISRIAIAAGRSAPISDSESSSIDVAGVINGYVICPLVSLIAGLPSPEVISICIEFCQE